MKEVILVDTGPLVAWMCEGDQWHRWVCAQMEALPQMFLTCEPVLTEVCFLIARNGGEPHRLLSKVREGFLRPSIHVSGEASALETLMKRYANIPMSLADACLVRLAEMHRHCRVFTLDRHFTRYRRYGRSVIPLLSP
jgi:uncharacterized protein